MKILPRHDFHDITELRNSYYALRHGRSLANEAELIVSHPDDGVPSYGLTDEGRQQVVGGLAAARVTYGLDAATVIVSSDFARARETAAIAATMLGVSEFVTTPQLRERFFGDWDKQHNRHYHDVWTADQTDPEHTRHGVESTRDVAARATALIRELEKRYTGRNIVLVSHGDTLQILQTAFERVTSSQHRSVAHLETGQIRKLQLKEP